MKLEELKEHCLKTLKQTEKFPTKTFEEHALVLRLIENQTSVIEELERIKEEMEIIHNRYAINFQGFSMSVAQECIDIINNEIAELKGEK